MMTREEREKVTGTAHHEAGHAVIAIRHGIGFEYVNIVDRPAKAGGIFGLPEWKERSDRKYTLEERRHMENLHVMTCAGPAAEKRFLGIEIKLDVVWDLRLLGPTAMYDLANSGALATELPGGYESCTIPLWKRAIAEVKQAWPEIELVARRLLDAETLTQAEVLELLQDLRD